MVLVRQYCGACHNVPSPDILPKHSWPAVIRTMADIGKQRTGREYIPADALRDITALYYGSSPTELPALPFDEVPSPAEAASAVEFALEGLHLTRRLAKDVLDDGRTVYGGDTGA